MSSLATKRFKDTIRPAIFRFANPGKQQFDCPICDYHGPFKDKRVSRTPDIVRTDSKCLGCGAAERHRMMQLVLQDVFSKWDPSEKSLLHIAPESCLGKWVGPQFATYHTADLCMHGVDFKEDVQNLSFADTTYDCILISRVLTMPPDLEASISEMRRVLRPGGLAIIAEIYSHEKTGPTETMKSERAREVGIDLLDLYDKHFGSVEHYLSDRFDDRYQLTNRMLEDGHPADHYPEKVRVPGVGFMELVAVCHA